MTEPAGLRTPDPEYYEIYGNSPVYTVSVVKRLVDIDDEALNVARTQLGTDTIKDTVNEALRRVARTSDKAVKKSLDRLGRAELERREESWR